MSQPNFSHYSIFQGRQIASESPVVSHNDFPIKPKPDTLATPMPDEKNQTEIKTYRPVFNLQEMKDIIGALDNYSYSLAKLSGNNATTVTAMRELSLKIRQAMWT